MERLARVTHTPQGFLYLTEPLEDSLPITDFRTGGDRPPLRPSPDLLETVYDMQRRQAWMRDELLEDEIEPLSFVSSFTTADRPEAVADSVRDTLELKREWAARESSWEGALRLLRDCVENSGILVVINGVVGNNTHRKLNPDEFRGFALLDEYAPLIFINNSDYKSAQMFTMAHELAHIFIDEDGVSNFDDFQPAENEAEAFCNSVAAEFLISSEVFGGYWATVSENDDRYQKVARHFKVSAMVAARRALDLELIDQQDFYAFYWRYQADERRREEVVVGGGNFWSNQNVRIGRRFGAAVVRAVKEGRLTYREAYSLTGLRGDSFEKLVAKASL